MGTTTKSTAAQARAGEIAEEILTYFDSYKLGSVAPISAIIEKELEKWYEMGIDAGNCGESGS